MLRTRDAGGSQVTPMELFFDLVYVFAVTQLSHLLLSHLSLRGAAQALLLLLAVWWAWIYTAWITNWFHPDHPAVRAMLIGVMLASLIMSAALPAAFGGRGLVFAGAYVVIQVGRTTFAVLALRVDARLRRNFQRILVWQVAAGICWLAGGLGHDGVRVACWVAALLVEYAAPAAGFFTPGLGRSVTTDWTITGEHLAERCQLFLIIALGESILVTGATFAGLPAGLATVAFVVAFLGSVALWWVYFARHAGDASKAIAGSADPGRLGRSAYTYFHLPMVAGIIVAAVGDELSIAHPAGPAGTATATAILAGPALFLAGHALFKRAVFEMISVLRLAAVGLLVALIPVGHRLPALLLAALATLVVATVAGWDTVTLAGQASGSPGRSRPDRWSARR